MKYKLLIVDDEVTITKSLTQILSSDRLSIECSENAEEALKHIEKDPPDILLTDHRMPGMLGVELLETVAELHPGIVCLLMSGFADFDALTAAVNQGKIYQFFMKPWRNNEIRQSLSEIVVQLDVGLEVDRKNRDIQDERDRYEEKLTAASNKEKYSLHEHLFNELPVALAITGPEGIIVDYNAKFVDLVGFDTKISDQSLKDLVEYFQYSAEEGIETKTGDFRGVLCRTSHKPLIHGQSVYHMFMFEVLL